MEYSFFLKIIISFITAGAWIAAATLLGERFGSKTGGLITNLPSNILISFLFIAFTRNIDYVREAAVSVPVGTSIDVIFLLIFIILLRYHIIFAVIVSLGAWFILAFFSMLMPLKNIYINILIFIIITAVSFFVVEKILKIRSVPRNQKYYTISQKLIRVLFAGCIVSGIVIAARFLDPFYVGIIATFPAVLLSSMVILSINQNREFAQATGKVLLLSLGNIIVFSSSAYFSFHKFGIVFGAVISFALSLLYLLLFQPVIKRIS
jgi:hypothetical protein